MMNRYRNETFELCRSKGWDKAPVSTVWLLFTEEIGELASAIRQYQRHFRKTGLKKDRGTDVSTEMGDVFSYLFQLAHMLNIDLDDMWEKHKVKVQERRYAASSDGGQQTSPEDKSRSDLDLA
jgi:NTP pyrophosphatase (non-canonical NTP hydrolase)